MLNDILDTTVAVHTCVPVALGAGRASLQDTVAAKKDAPRFDGAWLPCGVGGSLGVPCVLDNRRGCGVRHGDLPFLKLEGPTSLAWLRNVPLEAEIEDGDDDGQPPADSRVSELMSETRILNGALHLMHNGVADSPSRLKYGDEFWNCLAAFDKLFSDRHQRDRCSAQCLLSTPMEKYESLATDLIGWLASCPCHAHLFPNVSTLRRRRTLSELFSNLTHGTCATKGRRAPDMVVEAVGERFRNLCSMAFDVLTEKILPRIPEMDRQILQSDLGIREALR